MLGSAFDRDISRSFYLSFGIHLALIIMAYLGGKTFAKFFMDEKVEIIRSAVRVDVVGMPKFTVQELKALEKEANIPTMTETAKGSKEDSSPEVEDVVKKDDLVIQEKSKKKASFLNILSDYSNKKVSRKQQKKGQLQGDSKKHLETLIVEGNRLSKGSALVGDYSDEENSEFSAYVQALPGIIRQFWKLPSYLLEKNLRCRIRIYLSASGEVLKLEMQESSGQGEFDARAEKSIRDAAPFPRPSGSVGQRLTQSGIILGFPL